MTTLTTVDVDRPAAIAAATDAGHLDEAFAARLDTGFDRLHDLFGRLFGAHPAGQDELARVVALASATWNTRPLDLKTRDGQRLADPDWFQSSRMLGGMCFADRYAGNLVGVADHIGYFRDLGLTYLHLLPLYDTPDFDNDRGFSVSSHRRVNPSLGKMSQLADLAAELRMSSISLGLDVVLTRTSAEHDWARAAAAGDPEYADFYPDADDPLALDLTNPAVFRALAGDTLFLANQGVEVLRTDAGVAPLLLQALSAVLTLAAPGVGLASEATGPTGAAVAPGEVRFAGNPLQMALTWEALATRDARLLQRALDRRHALPAGTTWVNYVRSHDEVAWTFSDDDAAGLGIDPVAHRQFLTDFYVGRLDGSFARGVPFREDPTSGDARVAGTTASLAGIEAADPGGADRVVLAHAIALSTGGMPLLYLGDEVAQLNDYTYTDDPARRADSRWVHRGNRPRDQYAQRTDAGAPAGRVHRALTKLIAVRQATPEFGGDGLIGFHTPAPSVLGFQRPGPDATVLVLANVGDAAVSIDPLTLSGFARDAHDLVHGVDLDLDDGLELSPHGFAWVRVTPL